MKDFERPPLVSVIVLNYNGMKWIDRCLSSIRAQTVFDRIEVIVVDNASTDGSYGLAEKLIADWEGAWSIQNSSNRGFGSGINDASRRAHGRYLFFLNPDVWLEPLCVEEATKVAESEHAGVVSVNVMDYSDDVPQACGGVGFDILGIAVPPSGKAPRTLFSACGFCFIRTLLFYRIHGYDTEFFLYGEENDLSWRVQIAGEKIVSAPLARMHHRGAASVNPSGGEKIVEVRTTVKKRFYANRNNFLIILKNCQHVLLLLAIPYCLWVIIESLAGALLVGFSFFKSTCLDAFADCWRLRWHIWDQRYDIRRYRRCGDFSMLKFFSPRLSRWRDWKRFMKLGLPKIGEV